MPPWERISFAPPDDWVEPEPYDVTVRDKEGAHLTRLLWTCQVEAESGRSFHSTALRLETALAVQHESQWSLELDPRSQRVSIHFLRLVRNGERIDQLKRDQMRLIQRETQLERHVINGRWTLLVVLSGVRPGDVVEAAYTYDWSNPIRPDGCEEFFVVPPAGVVGRYRLSVLFAASRPAMRWQASADAPLLQDTEVSGGRRRWNWEGAQLTPREPEPNQPTTTLDYIWVQVSDLADCADLAACAADVWARQNEESGLAEVTAFARPETVDAAAIIRLVQYIQDEFRYLSLELAMGGWVPASPGVVARRRYGDCKDLAWLATTVLRRWDVAARPILVGTILCERVAALLPMMALFNHAIVEVEWAGETRWFDLTMNGQGGDFTGRWVNWFGHGLPVDLCNNSLRVQPGSLKGGMYSLSETVLLDTTRVGSSMVEQRVRVEGPQADNLRRVRLAQGNEAFAKEREQQMQRRYSKAKRLGELEWRDDRERNVCELAEAFEIGMAVYPDEGGKRAVFDVPANLILQCFALPEEKSRRGPWSMPYPFEVRHKITLTSPSMRSGTGKRRLWDEPEFEAHTEEPRQRGAWSKISRFTVKSPEVAAERLPAFRKQLEEVMRESGWRLFLPWGLGRTHRGENFGKLPEFETADTTCVHTVEPVAQLESAGASEAKLGRREGRRRRRRSLSRSDHWTRNMPGWVFRLGWVLLAGIVMSIARGCSHVSG